jgi:cytoskeletal protein RodZ
MRLAYSFTALILVLTSNVLAITDLESENAVTASWQTPGTIPTNLNPRTNNSETEGLGLQKRKLAVDPYTVPYPLQTGPTRYAPMAKKPGTAIPTTSPTPQFPASPYTIATAYLKPGTVEITLTASETVSVTMMENTVSSEYFPLFYLSVLFLYVEVCCD